MVSVLVVDDDQGIRGLLRAVLEKKGYSVSTAEHGGPALTHMLASREPLVVLLGLNMPILDGEDVLRAVTANLTLGARHHIIMVTGAVSRATTDPVAALRQQLGVPLIAKPFEVDEVLEAVARTARELKSTR